MMDNVQTELLIASNDSADLAQALRILMTPLNVSALDTMLRHVTEQFNVPAIERTFVNAFILIGLNT